MATKRHAPKPKGPVRGPTGRFEKRDTDKPAGRPEPARPPAEVPVQFDPDLEDLEILEGLAAAEPPNSKLTVPRIISIVAAVSAGVPMGMAAAAVHIARQTLHDWRTRHPVISDMLSRAEDRHAAVAIQRIVAAAECGDWRADAWWLERRRPDDFSRTQRLEGELNARVDWSTLVAEIDGEGRFESEQTPAP